MSGPLSKSFPIYLELLNQVKNNTFCLNFHKYNKNVPEAQATEKTEKKGNLF
jgi:hypothetical protein